MGLTDALVVLLVFFGMGYIILAHANKKNPGLIDKIKEWMQEKKKMPEITDKEEMERTYSERRRIF